MGVAPSPVLEVAGNVFRVSDIFLKNDRSGNTGKVVIFENKSSAHLEVVDEVCCLQKRRHNEKTSSSPTSCIVSLLRRLGA